MKINVAGTLASLAPFIDGIREDVAHRLLQTLPDYTSPPLPEALAATPLAFRDDEAVEAARTLDLAGQCTNTEEDIEACQILFSPSETAVASGTSKIGVVLYNGALVDPRAYSMIGQILSRDYGIPVALPIFANDLATLTTANGTCGSGRIPLASAAFPYVEKWVLVGHSYGGVAAANDMWASQDNDSVAGLVLLASRLRQDICAEIDFSDTNYPMADVQASLDGIINMEGVANATKWLPQNDTFHLNILGGNHGFFGTYNDTERTTILFQNDGDAIIPNSVQRELTIGAIMHVASRVGLPLPSWDEPSELIDGVESMDGSENGTDPSGLEENDDSSAGVSKFAASVFITISLLFASLLN
jgi:hypothetical protein